MQLLLLAIAPGIAICLFIFHRDAYNREPKRNLLMSFLLGVITVIPAALIERYLINYETSVSSIAIKAFLYVALVEEGVKFLALRFYAYPSKKFDEPLDGIVYAVMVSMGFATLENVLYVFQSAQTGQGYQVAFLRMFLAVPAHATFGVLMGYYAGNAKFAQKGKALLLLTGLFWAVLFHGLYDFFLFIRDSPTVRDLIADGLLIAGAIASFIIAVRLSFIHIKKHRKLSQQTYNPMETMSLRKAYEHDLPLIRDLATRIWPTAYGQIIPKEQIDYMLNMMYSERSLTEQMKGGAEFLLAYDSVEAVGFASVGLAEPGVYKLHKLYVLPSQQGRGTGKFLVDAIAKAAAKKGGTILRLNVNRQNPAVGFYEKIGFVKVAEEDIGIGEGYFMNDYVMDKRLA
ncbi:GNAT family N-acetyltransferase [Terrimonas sp. NA20]|uniref:GNAT family N-acetyltransferase n=1 Tax=Terrimonas ginsenosidimutans TaxID=2908004 RepID=A0ABS9KTN4_9BACT|nr:GNAT family N-acetyltransferase [Terrimonas ginsenosidimutans]MCG2615643.1 GNAT family N-acetyltransferase [Terrimonas ginsenosidimutans]